MFKRLWSLVAGLATAGAAFFRRPKSATQQRPDAGYTSTARRVRSKGRPGRAGDKLARMAAEGRLTIRKGW